MFVVSDIKHDYDDPEAPVRGDRVHRHLDHLAGVGPQGRLTLLPDNPHMLLVDSRYRGYTRVEIAPQRWTAELRIMETVQRRDAPCSTLATYVVEDGKPGPLRA